MTQLPKLTDAEVDTLLARSKRQRNWAMVFAPFFFILGLLAALNHQVFFFIWDALFFWYNAWSYNKYTDRINYLESTYKGVSK